MQIIQWVRKLYKTKWQNSVKVVGWISPTAIHQRLSHTRYRALGPGADPGVQAVSPKMTISHPPGGRRPLLSATPAVTFQLPSRKASPLSGSTKRKAKWLKSLINVAIITNFMSKCHLFLQIYFTVSLTTAILANFQFWGTCLTRVGNIMGYQSTILTGWVWPIIIFHRSIYCTHLQWTARLTTEANNWYFHFAVSKL